VVKVKEPAIIKRSPKNGHQKANKGENITFSCDPRGDMELKVTWTRLDKTLPDGNNETENTQLMFVLLHQPMTKTQLWSIIFLVYFILIVEVPKRPPVRLLLVFSNKFF
jgi:hypothetical protein